MKLEIFSMFDSKAQAFLPPFFLHNEAMARRMVVDAGKDETHSFARHPGDYSLYHLGSFDDSTAEVSTLQPQNLGLVSQIVGVYDSDINNVVPGDI